MLLTVFVVDCLLLIDLLSTVYVVILSTVLFLLLTVMTFVFSCFVNCVCWLDCIDQFRWCCLCDISWLFFQAWEWTLHDNRLLSTVSNWNGVVYSVPSGRQSPDAWCFEGINRRGYFRCRRGCCRSRRGCPTEWELQLGGCELASHWVFHRDVGWDYRRCQEILLRASHLRSSSYWKISWNFSQVMIVHLLVDFTDRLFHVLDGNFVLVDFWHSWTDLSSPIAWVLIFPFQKELRWRLNGWRCRDRLEGWCGRCWRQCWW